MYRWKRGNESKKQAGRRNLMSGVLCMCLVCTVLAGMFVNYGGLEAKAAEKNSSSKKTADVKSGDEKAKKKLVAKKLSSDVFVPEGAVIADLVYFCDGALEFKELSIKKDEAVRSYSGSKEGYEIIKEYVETLVRDYDFEYAGEPYYKSYSSGTAFFDFVLRYTGKEKLNDKKIEGTFSKTAGDFMIYGTIERKNLKGAVYYNPKITAYDDGSRYGSGKADNSLVGDSAAKALYLMPDGKYKTSDGRLAAAPGKAMAISDGGKTAYRARFVRDQDAERQEVYVEDKHGTTILKFYVPTGKTLKSGQIFNEQDFMIEAGYAVRDGGKFSKVPEYTWDYMFTGLHDAKYHVPITALEGDMKKLNVRVMYVKKNVVAVFHVGVRYDSAPYEEEYLIAVPIDKSTVSANKPDGEFTVYVGEKITIDGPKKFGSNYDRWKWEFVENSQLAKLTGAVSRSAAVTGKKAGDARIRVTYQYGIDEPDVLTGIKRNVNKTESKEYVIHIKKR